VRQATKQRTASTPSTDCAASVQASLVAQALRFPPGAVYENPGLFRVAVLPANRQGRVRCRVIAVLSSTSEYRQDEIESWPVNRFAAGMRRCLVMCFGSEREAEGN
jgi:hypothetical protein